MYMIRHVDFVDSAMMDKQQRREEKIFYINVNIEGRIPMALNWNSKHYAVALWLGIRKGT